jgi:phosphatidylglycerol lysyltransferase
VSTERLPVRRNSLPTQIYKKAPGPYTIKLMQQPRATLLLTRIVAYVVMIYGVSLVGAALIRQVRVHPGHHLDIFLITAPQIIGLGFVYLGALLLRRKYNAWLAAVVLFGISMVLEATRWAVNTDHDAPWPVLHVLLPVLIVALLWLSRTAFRVRSDVRSFAQAVRVSIVVLFVAFVYGVVGFSILTKRDFHQDIQLVTAMHQTIDQFGLTTNHAAAHSRRARLFLDSLSVISIAAVSYAAISFFDPIKMRLTNQPMQREQVKRLLTDYSSDIDDYFKLWPHDKLYFFDKTGEAGLAYHVVRGVALVVGNPFGSSKRFSALLKSFDDLCFVNDWLPAFIHVDERLEATYKKLGYRLQKIGEEAVLDLPKFEANQTGKSGKYFREIRNRFTKRDFRVEVVQPPHSQDIINRLREISDQWLGKPGRAERGFMLGYFNVEYLQQCTLVLLRDEAQQIQAFMNLVPTFESETANYDLLRAGEHAPGNANDFMVLRLIDHLLASGKTTLNLGLSPLAGLDDPMDSDEKTIIDTALRFLYSNGDRFYSFSGLQKFKDKYGPDWQPRYIAYPGGIRGFTRVLNALSRALRA